jgi:hypothetical protein
MKSLPAPRTPPAGATRASPASCPAPRGNCRPISNMSCCTKFCILGTLILVVCSAPALAQSNNSLKTLASAKMDTGNWKIFRMPEYNLEFQYPPEGNVDNEWVEALPGYITIDGLRRWPYSLKLYPVYTKKVLQGVEFKFPVRFIMLTDTAKLNSNSAKWYNWHETPEISMYPFDFGHDKDALLTAIERLYLGRPKTWEKVEPVIVDGKAGVRMSAWNHIGGDRGEQFLHEIVAVPVSTHNILIIQAGYFPQSGFLGSIGAKSVKQLKAKRRIFSHVVDSVKFLEN